MKAWLVALAWAAISWGGVAMALESPRYEVVRRYADFELRDYAPYLVAETEVEGDREEAGSEGFRRIAGYIFGGNRGSRKIAMTAPVTQQTGTRIDMTAPVSQQGDGGRWTLQFMMPSEWTRETLPVPNDPRVHIAERPARRVAVLRYSGTWSEENFARHRRELEGALAREGLRAVGAPEWARYDPPWKPWFLRKNEIQVEVGKAR
jgi:hypothetical protein